MSCRIKSFIFFFSILSLNSCSSRDNESSLIFADNINKNKIRVSMEVLASVPSTEIYNGEKIFKIPNGYGENEWYFSYNDSLTGYLRHIKTNRNDRHNYRFYFYESNDKYFVDITITGVSKVDATIELKKR